MRVIHEQYPSEYEIDQWVGQIVDCADQSSFTAEQTGNHGNRIELGTYHLLSSEYVRFRASEMEFYAYWQPVQSGPAPLLVHLPGYSGEISQHPELVAAGYNVLHISPMGYMTPSGPEVSKRSPHGHWPVLSDTVTSYAQKGYFDWLTQAVIAVKWAMEQPQSIANRVSFFGTSQGGGTALLMGSIFRERGVRCVAADLPFLTHFPLAAWRGAYEIARIGWDESGRTPEAWKALGYIDTMSHVHRLDIPVLLTSGGLDNVCPPETIESLFSELRSTKSLTFLHEADHRHTNEFIFLASAWFRLYA